MLVCGFGMLAGVDGILKFIGMYRVCMGYVWVCIGTYVCFFSEQCSPTNFTIRYRMIGYLANPTACT